MSNMDTNFDLQEYLTKGAQVAFLGEKRRQKKLKSSEMG